jgi:hypothetical protein
MIFLKTILVLVLAYYMVRLSFRLLLPLLIRHYLKKTGMHPPENDPPPMPEPEHGNRKRAGKSTVGEYVEYEEIN